MNVSLSSYECRAYTKKSGFIALHMKSHLLMESGVSFSVFAYLKSLIGRITFTGGSPIELDSIGVAEDDGVEYDGRILTCAFFVSTVTPLREMRSCVARLAIDYRFDFHGTDISGTHEHDVVVRKIHQRLS